MICLNCGRPNPSGTALCNRCRSRQPGLERARGGVIYQRTRETARVQKRGPNILAVGVLLLAGLIFAGGTLAVFMAPRGDDNNNVAAVTETPERSRLDIFEQVTPTPEPTPTPEITPTPLLTDPLLTPDPFATPTGVFTLPPSETTPPPTGTPTLRPPGTRTPTADSAPNGNAAPNSDTYASPTNSHATEPDANGRHGTERTVQLQPDRRYDADPMQR